MAEEVFELYQFYFNFVPLVLVLHITINLQHYSFIIFKLINI